MAIYGRYMVDVSQFNLCVTRRNAEPLNMRYYANVTIVPEKIIQTFGRGRHRNTQLSASKCQRLMVKVGHYIKMYSLDVEGVFPQIYSLI